MAGGAIARCLALSKGVLTACVASRRDPSNIERIAARIPKDRHFPDQRIHMIPHVFWAVLWIVKTARTTGISGQCLRISSRDFVLASQLSPGQEYT